MILHVRAVSRVQPPIWFQCLRPPTPKSAVTMEPSALTATRSTFAAVNRAHPSVSLHLRRPRTPKSATTVVPSADITVRSALRVERTSHPSASVQRRDPGPRNRPRSADAVGGGGGGRRWRGDGHGDRRGISADAGGLIRGGDRPGAVRHKGDRECAPAAVQGRIGRQDRGGIGAREVNRPFISTRKVPELVAPPSRRCRRAPPSRPPSAPPARRSWPPRPAR